MKTRYTIGIVEKGERKMKILVHSDYVEVRLRRDHLVADTMDAVKHAMFMFPELGAKIGRKMAIELWRLVGNGPAKA